MRESRKNEREVKEGREREREIPGIPEAIRMLGRSQTPAAILSRGVAGVLRGSLIVNMPGGSGAVRDGLAILLPVLEHACETIAGPVDHG